MARGAKNYSYSVLLYTSYPGPEKAATEALDPVYIYIFSLTVYHYSLVPPFTHERSRYYIHDENKKSMFAGYHSVPSV